MRLEKDSSSRGSGPGGAVLSVLAFAANAGESIASQMSVHGLRVRYVDAFTLIWGIQDAVAPGSMTRLHVLDHGHGDGTSPHVETVRYPVHRNRRPVFVGKKAVFTERRELSHGGGAIQVGASVFDADDLPTALFAKLRPFFHPAGRLVLHNCLVGSDARLVMKLARAVGVPVVASNHLVSQAIGLTGVLEGTWDATLTTGFPNGKYSTSRAGVYNMFNQ